VPALLRSSVTVPKFAILPPVRFVTPLMSVSEAPEATLSMPALVRSPVSAYAPELTFSFAPDSLRNVLLLLTAPVTAKMPLFWLSIGPLTAPAEAVTVPVFARPTRLRVPAVLIVPALVIGPVSA